MAYLRELVKKCSNPYCSQKATHTVVNSRNAEIGDYCKVHAKVKLQELHKEEQRALEVAGIKK